MKMNYTSIIAIFFSIILYSIFVVIIIEIAIAKEAISYQAGHNTTLVASPNNRVANISYNNASSVDPQLATDANNIYIVWSEDGLGNADILFIKSTDGGKTFSKPVNLSNSIGTSAAPVLNLNGNNVYVAWHDDTYKNFEIYFTKSTDGGKTFSKPVKLSQDFVNNRTTIDSEFPSIASSPSALYTVWQENSTGFFDILLRKSTDGGKTFSKPVNLSNNSGSSAFPRVAVYGNSPYVVWQDNVTGNFEILLRKSTDGGKTFSKPVNLSNNSGNSSDPAIFIYEKNVYLVWDDDSPGNADILFTKSTDGGKTFSKPVNLSNNIRGSFDPVLAISKNDIFVAWDDDSPGNADILFTKSTDRGNSFSIKPINLSKNVGRSLYPDVAISRSNNSYIGWSDDTPGNYEVFLLRNVQ
jgi:BNR repeat-like domain